MKKSYTKIPGQPLNKEIFNIRLHPSKLSQKPVSVRGMAQEVPEEAGTIEAEKGETIVGNMNNDGMPVFQKIGGKSHAQGGTILNAPDNAYVYSKFNKMKIKNPYILESFGLDPYTAKTPAQISTKYDFSDSTRGLYDPMSDKLQLKTYEMNIRNSVNKLGKLALAQEGIKGFPNGIPKISEPYLMNTGMSPELFIGNEPGDFNQQGVPMAKSGGQLTRVGKKKVKIVKSPNKSYMYGGGFEKYQKKGPVSDTTGLAMLDAKLKNLNRQNLYKDVWLNPNTGLGPVSPKIDNRIDLSKIQTPYEKQVKEMWNASNMKDIKESLNKIKKIYPEASSFFGHVSLDADQREMARLYTELERRKDRLEREEAKNKKEEKIQENLKKRLDNQLTIGKGVSTLYDLGQQKLKQYLDNNLEADPHFSDLVLSLRKLENYLPERDKHGVPYIATQTSKGFSQGETFSFYEPDEMANIGELARSITQNNPRYRVKAASKALTTSPAVGTGNVVMPATPTSGGLSPADSIAMLQNVQQQAPAVDKSGLIESSYTKEEAELLGLPWPPKKMYGGSLYKLGGSTSNYFAKFQGKDSQVQSGKLTPEQQKKLEELRASKAKVGKKGATQKKEKVSTIDPYYEEDPEKLIAKAFIIPHETLRKESVETSQAIDPSTGIAGKNVDVAAFKTRMAPYLKEFKKKYGRDFNYENTNDVKVLQEEYNPFVKKYVYDLAKSKGYPEEQANKLAEVFVKTQGFTGKYKGTDKKKLVRATDNTFGEFTSSRFFPDLEPYKTSEPPKTEPETEEEEPSAIEKGELKGTTEPSGPIGKWWWQDRVQSFADLMDRASIKKYYPQNFAPDVYLPQPTYYDPNRELAQQASVASTAARAARTIFDPSQASEILNNIQATAANQAANTIGRYANLNVGVANQFALTKSNLLNAYSRALAQGKTQEASQLAILNQQYDNSLRQMRARQTANYKQAITNMAKTDVLNSLYPQYAVDPETGGTRPVFLKGKVPTAKASRRPEDAVKEIRAIKDMDANMSIDDAIKIWQQTNGYDTAQNVPMTNPHQYPSSYPTYGYDGYSQTGEEEDTEDNQGTAYDYGYWDNMYNQPNYGDMEGEG